MKNKYVKKERLSRRKVININKNGRIQQIRKKKKWGGWVREKMFGRGMREEVACVMGEGGGGEGEREKGGGGRGVSHAHSP